MDVNITFTQHKKIVNKIKCSIESWMRLNVVKISNFLFKIIKNTLIFFINIFQILKLTEEYIYIYIKKTFIYMKEFV